MFKHWRNFKLFGTKEKRKGCTDFNIFLFFNYAYKEFQENLEKLVLLFIKYGITFIVFLYIENENIGKIPKRRYNFLLSTILVYSPEDILNYLSQKLNFFNPLDKLDPEEISEILNIKIPKATFKQNDEDEFQNGCFELAETFDVNLIKDKLILRFLGEVDYSSEFCKNIYYIYKDHKALDLFYRQNCLYFGWKLYPELYTLNICLMKKILYMYCREEKKREQSFYRIINDDLRSRDPSKIYQYINLLALINQLIEEESLQNYKGKVYRATKLDENLILKLVEGSNMVNTTFWSTSKDFAVAEKFMKKQAWRNAYIICETIKNNIDIDFEQLNPFNEKEVLFLPFTEFRVEKVSSENKFGKKIYIIEVTELGKKYLIKNENMPVEDVNNLGMKNNFDKMMKNNREEIEKNSWKY